MAYLKKLGLRLRRIQKLKKLDAFEAVDSCIYALDMLENLKAELNRQTEGKGDE